MRVVFGHCPRDQVTGFTHHQTDPRLLVERGVAVRQGLRFLRAELPGILATPSDGLLPRMLRIIEDLAGDWRRLRHRPRGASTDRHSSLDGTALLHPSTPPHASLPRQTLHLSTREKLFRQPRDETDTHRDDGPTFSLPWGSVR